MSERERQQDPAEGEGAGTEPGPNSPVDSPRAPRRSSRAAAWLATVLIFLLAGVALSPFWAPELAPLLPWGENRAEYAPLEERVAALEKRPAPPSDGGEAIKSATSALTRRVDQIETSLETRIAQIEKRPAPPSVDVEAMKGALGALAQRVDHLEGAANGDRQTEAAVAATRAALQQIDQRVATIETQSASHAASEADTVHKAEQELARLGKVETDLAERVTALERESQSQAGGELKAAGTLALLLGQMREAVEQARPFPAEFDAFVRLAHDPGLAAAVEPLAEPARKGVASRAVLVKRLAELAGQIAAEGEPAGGNHWGTQTLARLRSLVTIRRIDGPAQTGPEAAVSTAQAALARGDLAGAVAVLDPLTGAAGEAARPWLRMARERLAAEGALDHLQELLTARLGSPPAAPSAPPPKAPVEGSEKARTPS